MKDRDDDDDGHYDGQNDNGVQWQEIASRQLAIVVLLWQRKEEQASWT